MFDAELKVGGFGGHAVVALHGELDLAGVPAVASHLIAAVTAPRLGHGPGLQPAARPCQGPQPAPVRPGPGLRRRVRTPHQPDREHDSATATWRGPVAPPVLAGPAGRIDPAQLHVDPADRH